MSPQGNEYFASINVSMVCRFLMGKNPLGKSFVEQLHVATPSSWMVQFLIITVIFPQIFASLGTRLKSQENVA